MAKQKFQRGDLYRRDCPTRTVLDHLTSRWGCLVMIVLLERTHRFSELVERIGGVSEKMLAQTLRALEGDGFIQRTVYPTKPPKVEYSLTESGVEVAERVRGLTSWVEENLPAVMRFRERSNREVA